MLCVKWLSQCHEGVWAPWLLECPRAADFSEASGLPAAFAYPESGLCGKPGPVPEPPLCFRVAVDISPIETWSVSCCTSDRISCGSCLWVSSNRFHIRFSGESLYHVSQVLYFLAQGQYCERLKRDRVIPKYPRLPAGFDVPPCAIATLARVLEAFVF